MAFAADAALHSGLARRPIGALLYLLHLLNLLNTPCWAVGASAPFPKAWRAKPAMPLQAPGPDVRFTRTHGPPLRRLLCVLRVLCDSQNTLAVLPAAARRPSLCLSVFSVVSVFFVICGSPASCSLCTFVVLCVLRVFPKNLPHSPSGLTCRALAARAPISPCRRKAPNLPRPSANQPISNKRGAAAPFCLQLLTEKR